MNARHAIVFRKHGEFAAWPANYGLWAWGQEIVAVFARGRVGEQGGLHELDRAQPFEPWQARSQDGGLTWTSKPFLGALPGGRSLSADEHLDERLKVGPRVSSDDLLALEEPVDFLDPETIAMCARTDLAGDTLGWFYVSRDGALTWDDPFRFKGLELPIAARTDIVPLGTDDALFLVTTPKSDGREGQVLCACTTDGARTFSFRGFVGPEPEGYSIMPSSTLLANGNVLTVTRCLAAKGGKGWLESFTSSDQGQTWSLGDKIVESTGEHGNPAALVRVGGQLVVIYG
jgi:hypothetical protein